MPKGPMVSARKLRCLLGIVLPVLCASCETLAFYGQAAGGQWEIMRKSRSCARLIEDPATDRHLREKLVTIGRIRRFAAQQLDLPAQRAYGRYADLGRPYVVWVIYAAPEFSLEPRRWFYPIIGEMDYRGYFREADARSMGARLRAEGHDVFTGGVDAYSTLGWFHDPVLNTFVNQSDIDLAETIFHELTHRRLFVRGDTQFNESLATAVAEEGVKRWLVHQGRGRDLARYEEGTRRRREFHREIEQARADLQRLYGSKLPAERMRTRKAGIFASLRRDLRGLQTRWGGRGLESWIATDINNGHIVSHTLYEDRLPEFRVLLAECGGDFRRFFRRARELSGNKRSLAPAPAVQRRRSDAPD